MTSRGGKIYKKIEANTFTEVYASFLSLISVIYFKCMNKDCNTKTSKPRVHILKTDATGLLIGQFWYCSDKCAQTDSLLQDKLIEKIELQKKTMKEKKLLLTLDWCINLIDKARELLPEDKETKNNISTCTDCGNVHTEERCKQLGCRCSINDL